MKTETEKCVRCGIDTGIEVNTPVELRSNYIDGSGQLCQECYKKVYGKDRHTDK